MVASTSDLRDSSKHTLRLGGVGQRYSHQHRLCLSRSQHGITLIESILAIVVMSIAITILSRFLFPEVSRSATPYYQTRASLLGEAVMSEVLTRQFDKQSNPSSETRCGDIDVPICSSPQAFGTSAAVAVIDYYSVDDFMINDGSGGVTAGCWGESRLCSPLAVRGDLIELIPSATQADHNNFAVKVAVEYRQYTDGVGFSAVSSATPTHHKHIEVDVMTDGYGDFTYQAYRSNY